MKLLHRKCGLLDRRLIVGPVYLVYVYIIGPETLKGVFDFLTDTRPLGVPKNIPGRPVEARFCGDYYFVPPSVLLYSLTHYFLGASEAVYSGRVY